MQPHKQKLAFDMNGSMPSQQTILLATHTHGLSPAGLKPEEIQKNFPWVVIWHMNRLGEYTEILHQDFFEKNHFFTPHRSMSSCGHSNLKIWLRTYN